MDELRVGLIGYGQWASAAYVPALRLDGRARVVAAAAPSEATRNRIRSDLGPDVATYPGYEELLAGEELHAVLISVPDRLHEPALRAALARDVPTLYEPPVAACAERVRPMLRELLAARQVVHADLELSYLPVVAAAAERVAAGAIGEVRTAAIRMQDTWGELQPAELGLVGALAPWYLDPLNQVLHARPARILAMDGRGSPGRRQAYAKAQLDYDGVWGEFEAITDGVGPLETSIEVNGSDGDIVADLIAGELRMRTRRSPDWSITEVPALAPRAGWPGMHECIRAFLDAVASGAQSRTGPEVAARHHLAGLAADESIDSGGWVAIETPDEL